MKQKSLRLARRDVWTFCGLEPIPMRTHFRTNPFTGALPLYNFTFQCHCTKFLTYWISEFPLSYGIHLGDRATSAAGAHPQYSHEQSYHLNLRHK